MNQDNRSIEDNFREALQVLAITPEQQVECTIPGDVPVDIMEDFLHWGNAYSLSDPEVINPDLKADIEEITKMLHNLPDSVFCIDNLQSMQQPHWEPLRIKAKLLLQKLDWPLEQPTCFIDDGTGVYRRR